LIADSSTGLKLNRATVGFQFNSLAHTSGDTFDYSSQDDNAQDVSFKSDGTKMYISGNGSDKVHQYSLSEAWDATTASYDNISTTLGDTTIVGHTFSADGTKLYSIGLANDIIRRYDLSTAWDLSTSTYAHQSASMSPETSATSVRFNSDGTKMYVIGNQYNKIYQWDLSPAWSVSGKGYSNVDASLSTSTILSESSPRGLHILPDGSTIYVVGADSGAIYKLGLTNAGDISGGYSYSVSTDRYLYANDDGMSANDFIPGLNVSADGTKLYLINGADDRLVQYSMGSDSTPTSQYFTSTTNSGGQIDTESWTDLNSLTADETLNDGATYYAFSTDGRTTWKVQNSSGDLRSIARLNSSTWQYNSSGLTSTGYDIANASYDNVTFSVASQETNPNSIIFNNDGTKLFLYGSTGDSVYEYHLSTAYDLSTMSYDSSLAISGEASPQSLNFSADGTNLYTLGRGTDTLYQYPLSTAFDLSTAGTRSSYYLGGFDTGPSGIAFKSDGTKMYFVGYGSDNVVQFSLSTAWDITTATSDSVTLSVSTQTGIPRDLRFRPDGTEFYIIGSLSVFKYSLTTAWDLSTASYSSESFSVQPQDSSAEGICFNSDGTKMYAVGYTNDNIYQYSTASSTEAFTTAETWVDATYNNQQAALQQALSSRLANRLTGTDLATYSDANLLATGDTFDLMIGLYMGSAGTSPTSDAITISYDGSVQNKGAILGTDYDVEKLSDTQLKFTALTQKNMHFKVI